MVKCNLLMKYFFYEKVIFFLPKIQDFAAILFFYDIFAHYLPTSTQNEDKRLFPHQIYSADNERSK